MIFQKNFKEVLVGGFFLTLIIVGLFIFRDYGISADEEVERRLGIINLNYLADLFNISFLQRDHILQAHRFWPTLEIYYDHAFGPLFAEFSVLLERLLQINSDREIYFLRHALNFLIFVAGVFSLFKMSERRFNSWKVGLLTALMLVLSPRIFADAFYNSKDLVFLSFFLIATNASVYFLTNKSIVSAVFAGLAIGLAIDVRPMAIILPAIIIFVGAWSLSSAKDRPHTSELKAQIYLYALLLAFSALTTLLFWPWLWSAPIDHFIQALSAFSRWVRSDLWGMYNGHLVRSTQLPWHYVPVWIGITTPIAYIAFFVIGIASVLSQKMRGKLYLLSSPEQMQDMIFLGLFCAPILAVIVLQSVVYDGWRHLYFIYPAFLMLATSGLVKIWDYCSTHLRIRFFLTTCFFLCLISTGFWMITAHPFQNTYFNIFAGKNLKEHWELDYWGLSNAEQLKYILANDSRKTITVRPASFTNVELATRMIKPADRDRIHMVNELDQADYLISNYRYKDEVFIASNEEFSIWRDLQVDQETISTIFKRQFESALVRESLFALGRPIEFSRNHLIAPLLMRGAGWAQPEATGTWSLGSDARLVLSPPTGSKILRILVKPLVIHTGTPQIVDIALNQGGQRRFSFKTQASEVIELPLLKQSQAGDILTVNFHFPSPIRPKDYGIGNDDRLLAIQLIWLKFD